MRFCVAPLIVELWSLPWNSLPNFLYQQLWLHYNTIFALFISHKENFTWKWTSFSCKKNNCWRLRIHFQLYKAIYNQSTRLIDGFTALKNWKWSGIIFQQAFIHKNSKMWWSFVTLNSINEIDLGIQEFCKIERSFLAPGSLNHYMLNHLFEYNPIGITHF